jgi:integrase
MSLLLDLGVPPHVVREIVGHSAIEVTMMIYAHAALDEKRKALRKPGDSRLRTLPSACCHRPRARWLRGLLAGL